MLQRANLQVAPLLADFIETRALPGTGIDAEAFWRGFGKIFDRFAPRNRALLATRERLQGELDGWHRAHMGKDIDQAEYQGFLRDIGYLVAEPDAFTIDPKGIDDEIATIAGPQLVAPMLNARFLLNAANARWGSLYDALYGSDAIPGAADGPGYDAARGARVVAWGRDFLDAAVPLADGSWADWDGDTPVLADPALLVGVRGEGYLLRHNGLHIEIVVDRDHPVGARDAAGVADIVLESALSTICDLEDSVAAVDAADKVAGYANWLGLIRGDLTASFAKNGNTVERRLAPDRDYLDLAGNAFDLPGRALLLVRNVGHLMTSPAVRLADGSEAPEGILDAIVTGLIGLHDVKRLGAFANSRAGSIYIVKPKMHGPDECAFSNDLFDAVEDLLGLARYSIKIGVMDEERRTSANLAACIAAVKHRIFFVNTGFLDRTGDEIHSAMEAGAMLRKGDMKRAPWIAAYEDRNVQIALAAGFSGRAQIGKGMWAAPDRMAEMLDQKIGHPQAGANTAWVPSPTAATLHATHYHRRDVFARQADRAREPVASLDNLLTVPLARGENWSAEEVRAELDNNAQSLLGYVVRWVQQGIGCSTVPDIADVGLMEDRATLRISSQHIANWLHHGIVTSDDVDAALDRMAARVDAQNAGDPDYRAMAGRGTGSIAFAAARALIYDGAAQPNGYTEPLLHAYRLKAKAQG